jgi:purine-cytosine permease-like protein
MKMNKNKILFWLIVAFLMCGSLMFIIGAIVELTVNHDFMRSGAAFLVAGLLCLLILVTNQLFEISE